MMHKDVFIFLILFPELHILHILCKSKKTSPHGLWFSDIFSKRLRILNQLFTHLLYVPIYARLQIFIQFSPTLMSYAILSATT